MTSLHLQEGPQGLSLHPEASDQSQVISGRPFESYSEIAQEEALRRRAYVDTLSAQAERSYSKDKLDLLIQKIAIRIGDKNPPSSITVYRWHKRLIQGEGDLCVLVPRFHFRGGKGQRLGAERLSILQEEVQRVYLTLKRKPIQEAYDSFMVRLAALNQERPKEKQLALPSYETVRRYIRSLPKYEVDLARYGREYVRKKYRHSGITPSTTYILERAEIDHTPLNLFVIDESTQLVLGRPHVTWAVDCHSRMIIGFYLSFSPPGIEAVFRCLKHAISNKEYVAEKYPDIQHAWPCHGVPRLLVVDNGLEFHSKDLFRATYELGIDYQFCPARTPWYKPMVERSFRSLAEKFAHLIPGTSFANWFDRYGYDPLKEGIITLSELVHALHIWVIDIYSQSLHRGITTTPFAAWEKSAEIVPPKTVDVERLHLILSQQDERVLGHAGIELHGLRYNCEELHLLRKQLGDRLKVQVRFDPDDLGSIYVLHPMTKEPIAVPCLMPEYSVGLQLCQHALIRKALITEGISATNPLELAQAKARMQAVIDQLVHSKKLSNRKKAARLSGRNSLKEQNTVTVEQSPGSDTTWDDEQLNNHPSVLQVLSLDTTSGGNHG